MTALKALSRSQYRWPIAGLLAVTALVIVGFGSGITSAARTNSASGALQVGPDSFTFTPTSCQVTNDDFVVAGPGSNGGDSYWVSASVAGIEVAFGTDSSIEEPIGGDVWLASATEISWTQTANTVTASAVMIDRNDPEEPTLDGRLRFACAG